MADNQPKWKSPATPVVKLSPKARNPASRTANRETQNPQNFSFGSLDRRGITGREEGVHVVSPETSARRRHPVVNSKVGQGLPRIQSSTRNAHPNQCIGSTSLATVGTRLNNKVAVSLKGKNPGLTTKSTSQNFGVIKCKSANPHQQKMEKKSISPMSKALVPRHQYTVKPIIPAKKAELLDVARAMHRDQFAARVKKLFDPEREAAIQAIETGIYIGWRCPGNNFDCIRVSNESRCFCGHSLNEHESFQKKRSHNLKCLSTGCSCKKFAFIPSRPEDIGEWWLQKRRGFDVSTWRAKCRCKHTHEEHSPNSNRKCNVRSCTCFTFDSNFLCAACDKHWEEHETCFDNLNSRQFKGLPYGEEYLPFHELPQLRNIVLTGTEDDNSHYNELVSGKYAIPRQQPTQLALQLQGKKNEL